jgi:hypothetical protein
MAAKIKSVSMLRLVALRRNRNGQVLTYLKDQGPDMYEMRNILQSSVLK